jgi:hypothetical protein
MARRVASPRAAKVASSRAVEFITIWLSYPTHPSRVMVARCGGLVAAHRPDVGTVASEKKVA